MSHAGKMAADGLFAAVLFALQVSMLHLPNIELVSLMVILYTLVLGKRVLNILITFTILEGVFHGFGIWWVSYLYIWPILAGLTALLRQFDAPDWVTESCPAYLAFLSVSCAPSPTLQEAREPCSPGG